MKGATRGMVRYRWEEGKGYKMCGQRGSSGGHCRVTGTQGALKMT